MSGIKLEKVCYAVPGTCHGPKAGPGAGDNTPMQPRPILDCIDLTVPRNGFTVILGPSGSGKTTLLNMVAGTASPSSGRVLIDGVDVTCLEPAARNIGYVFQEYSLFPNMTVIENVAFGLEMRDMPKLKAASSALAALERVGLASLGQRLPATLSGGEKQRVALVRSLVYEPTIVLLDEPFSSVDPITAAELRRQVAEIRGAFSGTFLMVTHSREEAMELADTLVILDNGRVVEAGARSRVLKRPRKLFTACFLGAANILACSHDGKQVEVKNLGGFDVDPAFSGETVSSGASEARSAAWCVIRGEDIGPAAGGEANSFRGTVLSVEDRLTSLSVGIQAEKGAFLLWHATPGILARVPEPGDRLLLRVRSGDLHLVTD